MAQAECKNVTMNKKNPHFGSSYADLSAVRDMVIPIFTKHGFSIIQAPNYEDGVFFLETALIHTSGAHLRWRYPLPGDPSKVQQIGGAITYARRYTLSSIACIASEEDIDGEETTDGRGSKALNGLPPTHTPRPGAPGGIVL